MLIEVSNGEIVDKFTITELKLKYIEDFKKLSNVGAEHAELKKSYELLKNEFSSQTDAEKFNSLYNDLYAVNDQLWHVEERLRKHERLQDFGETFIARARQVYTLNDERSAIKKEINVLTKSVFIEEKSY